MKIPRPQTRHRRPFALLICLSTSLTAAAAEPSEGVALEEVTVTAQRRSESLQAIPIAITAVTAADMEREGIHELGTLAAQVPGLTFSPFAPGQNIVSLRGVYGEPCTYGISLNWHLHP